MASGLAGLPAVKVVGMALEQEDGAAIILLLKEVEKIAQDLVELLIQKPVTNNHVQVNITIHSLNFLYITA